MGYMYMYLLSDLLHQSYMRSGLLGGFIIINVSRRYNFTLCSGLIINYKTNSNHFCYPHFCFQVLEETIRPDTALVSVMFVNNEIGVKQPVEEIGALCRQRKVFFHTDAAQAVGKVPVDVNSQNIDLMSISGHKVYGPKG